MATFNLLGDIVANDGARWFESDVVPGMVIGWLAKQDGDVEININSNGGDVAGGLAIANAIRAYDKGKVTCNVLGVAASMASVVACAGDKLAMGEGAFLMVHNPWTVTMGNADELRKDADTLDKMRDSILGFYQSKTGKTADELKALLDAESWISRDEARNLGFSVEDYAGEFRAAASLTRRSIENAPEAVRAMLAFRAEKPVAEEPAPVDKTEEKPVAEAVEEKPAAPAENWEARFKGLSQKFNAMRDEHAAALAERDAKIESLTSQLDQSGKDLAAANAKVSALTAEVEEKAQALRKAEADLAETRDSLATATDKVTRLESTRDLLTSGVLSPNSDTYAAKMKAARTPEEREHLRALKSAGKIK